MAARLHSQQGPVGLLVQQRLQPNKQGQGVAAGTAASPPQDGLQRQQVGKKLGLQTNSVPTNTTSARVGAVKHLHGELP